jgi:diguanylate cyclase (GGDEF)-like protein/PAS domain S-box-containing protein
MIELLGQPVTALNQPHIDKVLQGHPEQFERPFEKPDGQQAYLLATYIPDFDSKSVVIGFFVLMNDITLLKKSEVELKLAASVFDSISEGIMIIGADETVVSVNSAFTDITGYAAEEMMGRVPRVLDAAHHEPAEFEAMRTALESTSHWEGEVWERRKDGESYMAWQSISMIRGADGKAARYVSVFSDNTARWKTNERTKHLALHDPLTGLPNRRLLLERLDQSMARAQREGRHLALFFVDLDGFKSINDQWGHAAGDEVLKFVANTLLDTLRTTDTVARLGGDEFVLLLENPANQEEVANLAERVIAAIQLPPSLQQTDSRIGASIGIAMLGAHAKSVGQLMKSADSAMYAAKAAGKSRFLFFTPGMQSDR